MSLDFIGSFGYNSPDLSCPVNRSEGELMSEGFIEVALYDSGNWVRYRLTRLQAEQLYHQLGVALGAPQVFEGSAPPVSHLKVYVE